MKISVIIPAYNCAATIQATLDSVLNQTHHPDEILVMDDGSTDETPSILESYKSRIRVFRQPNGGPASGRNALLPKAGGDLIAFLDSDDLWHPKYLENQFQLFCQYPDAAAIFAGHRNIYGNETCTWRELPVSAGWDIEIIPSLSFFNRYNRSNGPFSSYSFCCVPKRKMDELGPEPFRVDGAEDFYCTALLCLLGPVVYNSTSLAAYRVREDSYSSKRLEGLAARVQAFELLKNRYKRSADPKLSNAFDAAFASHRRSYAKYLMGVQQVAAARSELRCSMVQSRNAISLGKSMVLLLSTYAPRNLQPIWPTTYHR
jgi:glycosyltransferase involved in cell wall biosynthesis